MGELRDDHDEDEVEEQLQEGHPPVGRSVLVPTRQLPQTTEDRRLRHGSNVAGATDRLPQRRRPASGVGFGDGSSRHGPDGRRRDQGSRSERATGKRRVPPSRTTPRYTAGRRGRYVHEWEADRRADALVEGQGPRRRGRRVGDDRLEGLAHLSSRRGTTPRGSRSSPWRVANPAARGPSDAGGGARRDGRRRAVEGSVPDSITTTRLSGVVPRLRRCGRAGRRRPRSGAAPRLERVRGRLRAPPGSSPPSILVPHEAEQEVLGPDGPVPQVDRLAERELERLLRLRREGDVARPEAPTARASLERAGAEGLLDRPTDLVQVDADAPERVRILF